MTSLADHPTTGVFGYRLCYGVTDGTSNTVAFCEAAVGNPALQAKQKNIGNTGVSALKAGGALLPDASADHAATIAGLRACDQAWAGGTPADAQRGKHWARGVMTSTLFNTVAGPKVTRSRTSGPIAVTSHPALSAYRFHPGGVYTATDRAPPGAARGPECPPHHSAGFCQMNTGSILGGRSSLGSRVSYGLGTENQNLPSFVVMQGNATQVVSGPRNRDAGFMPAVHQGVRIQGVADAEQRGKLDFPARLNRGYAGRHPEQTELEARIASYELAFRMQAESPEAVDDLGGRGLLDQTLVIWGGEFGRTPMSEKGDGRDHNPTGFTMWMAGGGVRGGQVIGETDELGLRAVTDRLHVRDLHAMILALLGVDLVKLVDRHKGRPERPTLNQGEALGRIATG